MGRGFIHCSCDAEPELGFVHGLHKQAEREQILAHDPEVVNQNSSALEGKLHSLLGL